MSVRAQQHHRDPPSHRTPTPAGRQDQHSPQFSVRFVLFRFPIRLLHSSLSTKTNIYQLTVPVHSVGGHGGNVSVLLYTKGGKLDQYDGVEMEEPNDDGGKGL